MRFSGKALGEAEEKKVLLSLRQSEGLRFEGGLCWMLQEEVRSCDKCFSSTVLRCCRCARSSLKPVVDMKVAVSLVW